MTDQTYNVIKPDTGVPIKAGKCIRNVACERLLVRIALP